MHSSFMEVLYNLISSNYLFSLKNGVLWLLELTVQDSCDTAESFVPLASRLSMDVGHPAQTACRKQRMPKNRSNSKCVNLMHILLQGGKHIITAVDVQRGTACVWIPSEVTSYRLCQSEVTSVELDVRFL